MTAPRRISVIQIGHWRTAWGQEETPRTPLLAAEDSFGYAGVLCRMSHPVSHLELALTDALIALQHDIERKLGSNLLQLQRYELLMKWLLNQREVSVTLGDAQEIKLSPSADVSNLTLGVVKKELLETYIQDGSAESAPTEGEEVLDDLMLPLFKASHSISMSPERYAQTKTQLQEVVDMRNELVHHFLERFDITGKAGCIAAGAYLDDLFGRVGEHFIRLQGWAISMQETRRMMAQILATPEIEDCFLHGIRLGRAGVNWSVSTIVQLLRNAERDLNKDGWTSLDDAIAWIRAHDPKHTPKKYGCSTWRQVIHESCQFETQKTKLESSDRVLTWYRSRVA